MSHDQNFKNLILDYPHQALRFFAADEAADIDERVTITPIRQEQLKDRLGDRFLEVDVPLLAEWPDGRREALLFLLEEETRARRFSIYRLVSYCASLAELLGTDRIVPVVIFLDGGHRQSELRLGGDLHTYLHFHYLVCDLARIDATAWLESDNIVARLNLPAMAYPPSRKIDIYAQAMRGLFNLETDPERQAKYLDFIDIYADLDDNERKVYEQRYPEEVQKMTTFADRFIEKGFEEGIEKGIEKGIIEGKAQGQASVLLKQLQIRFGGVDSQYRQRIEQADADTLLLWAERVLTADSIEDVFI